MLDQTLENEQRSEWLETNESSQADEVDPGDAPSCRAGHEPLLVLLVSHRARGEGRWAGGEPKSTEFVSLLIRSRSPPNRNLRSHVGTENDATSPREHLGRGPTHGGPLRRRDRSTSLDVGRSISR